MIDQLVSRLPEIYQPIYGHPELSGQVSRASVDRFAHINRIYAALVKHLERPLRVLDLGCAQGFFSLSLGAQGAEVMGVDYLRQNVEVCQALAAEAGMDNVRFVEAPIEEVITSVGTDSYDLVLGLSVFHHLVHKHGAERVQSLLTHLAEHIGTLLLELALREEPLYWGPSQPEDPLTLLESIAFVYEIAKHPTHLGEIVRPLIAASNRYWILGHEVDQFMEWSTEPHCLAGGTHAGSRRYFFSSSKVLKLYSFDPPRGDHNRQEFLNEVALLRDAPTGLRAPNLISFEQAEAVGWVLLERIPGKLLVDLISEGAQYNSHEILLDVLTQLGILEAHGFYHNDVRTWNVIVRPDGKGQLIDYGSITGKQYDCIWPHSILLSFIAFVHDVTTGSLADSLVMTRSMNPSLLPEPYQSWVMSFWFLPQGKLNFRFLQQSYPSSHLNDGGMQDSPLFIWLNAAESLISDLSAQIDSYKLRLAQSHAEAQLNSKKLALVSEHLNQISHANTLLETSLSWRMTSPLRNVHDKLFPILETPIKKLQQWKQILSTRIQSKESQAINDVRGDLFFAEAIDLWSVSEDARCGK